MKKILFLLLCTVSIYGQTTTGQEQEFDYGIKNNSTQTITTPPYLTTTGMDGTQGKIPSALIEKTDNKQNSLAVDGTGTKYPTVDAVNTGLDLKALDSNVVHKTGEETIGLGEKYFTDNVNFTDIAVSRQAIGRAALYPNEFVIKSQLDLKANLASPTFTGTVSGIDKTMVGLTNVDNTSDVNKPISTATQTALNGKENSFTKNTAFNKNFGTTAGTVAGGNDSRILNGQTAFGWGNHASAGYALTTGSNINQSSFRTALGLGSNAYTSTAYLPLSGGTLTGDLTLLTKLKLQSEITDTFSHYINPGKWEWSTGILFDSGDYIISRDNGLGNPKLRLNSIGDIFITGTVIATSYTGSATLTGTPTAPTAAPGTTGNQIATLDYVQAIRPYKVYTALYSQNSTSNPTVVILENTLGTVTFTRSSSGVYLVNSSGLFTADKTFVIMGAGTNATYTNAINLINSSTFSIVTKASSTQSDADSANTKVAFEIRVYN